MLMSVFPFFNNHDRYDKPVNTIIKPLNDELGWDRVKKIFSAEYVSCTYAYLNIKSSTSIA